MKVRVHTKYKQQKVMQEVAPTTMAVGSNHPAQKSAAATPSTTNLETTFNGGGGL